MPLQPNTAVKGLVKSPVPNYPQERIVVDERWSNLNPPIAVVRKAKSWQPFIEDYVIDNRPEIGDSTQGEACLVCVFANIEPADLLRLVGALHHKDVEQLTNDPTVIEKLIQARGSTAATTHPN